MTIRKHMPLLALLLVIVMTAQAAALSLSCQGTASCCCSGGPAGMDMTAGMTAGCCEDGASQSCGLENAPAADAPYRSVPVTDSVEAYAAVLLRVVAADRDAAVKRSALRAADRPGPGGPPLFLRFQTFLC